VDRDAFLGRIRARVGAVEPVDLPAALPRTMVSGDGRLAERFAAELDAVGGECRRAAASGLTEAVASAASGLTSAVVQNDLGAYREDVVTGLRDAGCRALDADRDAAGTADLGITSALLGVASTGSVLLSSASGPRSTGLLPPAHLVILVEDAIVPGFEELMAELGRLARETSHLVLITGPSRTSDIEMTTVRGVHGPERVIVLVVG
jgi:L-lactate dehydrogenase complex protein LldG